MEFIRFPISREAACCGIYIYLGSTRVGMKSKEELRSDYLRKYEDNYRAGWEKRKAKMLQKCSKDKESLDSISEEDKAEIMSLLGMLNDLCSPKKKPEIVIKEDSYSDCIGAVWEEPKEEEIRNPEHPAKKWVIPKSSDTVESEQPVKKWVIPESADTVEQEQPVKKWVINGLELFSVDVNSFNKSEFSSNNVSSESFEASEVTEPAKKWVIHGLELFSVEVKKPKTHDNQCKEVPTDDSDLFETEEETFEPEEETSEDLDGYEDLWDDDEPQGFVPEEDAYVAPEPVKAPKRVHSQEAKVPEVKQTVVATQESRKTISSVNLRLDENGIRDFVKQHKLCTESDIVKAFEGYDKNKVNLMIKSALRKYKIFEKHGKFTV